MSNYFFTKNSVAMKVKFPLLPIFLFCTVCCWGQSSHYFVNGQAAENLPQNLHWYAVMADNSVQPFEPELIQRLEKSYLHAPEKTVLVIGSKAEIKYRGGKENPFKQKPFLPGSSLTFSPEEILFAALDKNAGQEKYMLGVHHTATFEEVIIFSNCKPDLAANQPFACGVIPFTVEFYGDLTGDGSPEVLLGTAQESTVLKVLIGKEDGKYKVIYRHQSD